MNDLLIMTPGPTEINKKVLQAMAVKGTNPDLDVDFFDTYKEAVQKYQKIVNTQHDSFILSGEGILGLEAACASLIEPGDRVLCITNGIFGDGFGDFVKMYGGEPEFFRGDLKRAIDVELLEAFINTHDTYKLATLVHCETPSGITNPIDKICPLLHKYGIVSIVDSVSAIAGEHLETDKWHVDVLLGGSQKCLSAPAGLTFVTVSPEAWKLINQRKQPVTGFYCNLAIWQNWYDQKWFPYTQPLQHIYGMIEAFNQALNKDFVEIHCRFGQAVRNAVTQAGLTLYAQDGYSNTVTTVCLPEGLAFKDLFEKLKQEHRVLIAGGFDFLQDKIFRIGHMGENCYQDKMMITMRALDQVLHDLDVPLTASLEASFKQAFDN